MKPHIKNEKYINGLLLLSTVLVALVYELLNHPTAHVYILRTSLDGLIPRVPAFAVPYLLFLPVFWLVILYSFAQVKNFRPLAIAVVVIHLVSYAFYLLFQTYVPREPIVGTDIFSSLLRHIYTLDQPYNGFPSLHAALATLLTFYFVWLQSRWKWLAIIFSILVILSTLLVKQHFIPDVIVGVILGLAIPLLIFKSIPRRVNLGR